MLTLQNQTGKGCLDLRRALAPLPIGKSTSHFWLLRKSGHFFCACYIIVTPLSLVWVQLPFAPEAPADKRRAAPKSGGRALIGAASRLFCCMRRILISIGFLFSRFPAGSLCSDTVRTSDIINACVKYTPVYWMYLFIISDIIAYSFKN